MISLFDIKRILTPEKSTMPCDDFRIIQSWAEYDETSGKNPENKNLNYLCYELEVMNPDTGERIHLFKAICQSYSSSGKCKAVYCFYEYAAADISRCL